MAVFKGLVKLCEVCGTEFKVPQSQKKVRTCSRECGYKIRAVANKVEWARCKCKRCGKEFLVPPCHEARRIYCSNECRYADEQYLQGMKDKVSGSRNPMWKDGASVAVISKSGKSYFRSAAKIEQARNARRETQKKLATPQWASPKVMRGFYRVAKQMSRTAKTQYHVDHIVPLQHPLVCGLHCEANLRIVAATDNLTKHNRTWPDMPD